MRGHNIGFYAEIRKIVPKVINGSCKDNPDMPDLVYRVYQ